MKELSVAFHPVLPLLHPFFQSDCFSLELLSIILPVVLISGGRGRDNGATGEEEEEEESGGCEDAVWGNRPPLLSKMRRY